jgi:protein subunit release factor A
MTSLYEVTQHLILRMSSVEAMLSRTALSEPRPEGAPWLATYQRDTLSRWSSLQQKLDALSERLGWKAPSDKEIERTAECHSELDALEQRYLLSLEDNFQNAVVIIQPKDLTDKKEHEWCRVLAFMYRTFATEHSLRCSGFIPDTGDALPLSERIYVLFIEGLPAYGLFRGETGIHQRKTRHYKSVAQVDVWPEPPSMLGRLTRDQVQIEAILGRASNAGLFVRPRSAVRLTHMETQTSLSWGEFLTQPENIENGLRALTFWIRVVRSEILLRTYQIGDDPFVRDHILGLEEGDADAVLRGHIHPFVRGHLRVPLRVLGL